VAALAPSSTSEDGSGAALTDPLKYPMESKAGEELNPHLIVKHLTLDADAGAARGPLTGVPRLQRPSPGATHEDEPAGKRVPWSWVVCEAYADAPSSATSKQHVPV
jgi:hypothetical protein